MPVNLDLYSYGSIKVIGKERIAGKINTINVGKFTSIAGGVQAIMVGHDPRNVSNYPFNSIHPFDDLFQKEEGNHPVYYGDIEIGNDVWIGQNVTLIGGSIIQDGAVVAANSVVRGLVPAYTIYAGNPAIFFRYRFKQNIINALLEIKWWDWPIEKINKNVRYLCDSKVVDFVNEYFLGI